MKGVLIGLTDVLVVEEKWPGVIVDDVCESLDGEVGDMTPAVADGVHELVEVWIGGGGGGDEVEVAIACPGRAIGASAD